MSRRVLLPVGLVLLLPALCAAQAIVVIGPDRVILPVPPRPEPAPGGLAVKSTRITVQIRDQVATTTLEQVLVNRGSSRLEADFLFPIPKNAHVEKFTMEVAGKQQPAELLDADKARRIYEEIVRRTRDPGLLEYVGQNLLRMRVFPIEPHSEKPLTLRYTQLLRSDAGLVSYAYPLGAARCLGGNAGDLTVRVEVESSKPLKSLYSPSHDVEVRWTSPRSAVVGFESAGGRGAEPFGGPGAGLGASGGEDFQLFFAAEGRHDVAISVLPFRDPLNLAGEDEGYFLLLASPGKLDRGDKVVPKDVVFVLDTSGSMTDNKLEQARRALRFCIDNLNAEDRFEIIRFSTEAEELFGSLAPVDEAHRDRAATFIKSLRPIGGTAIFDALTLAARYGLDPQDGQRPLTVIFLTDGKPTIGPTDEDQIVSAVLGAPRNRPVRVFCFGIGTDINTHLLDKVTEKTNAVSQYVLPDEDIELKVSSFYTKISAPVLTNLRLEVEGPVKLTKMYPTQLPDLFAGDQLVAVGRYSGAGDVAIRLIGHAGSSQQTVVYEATFPEKATDHDFVPRLWAVRRVGFLLDEIRLRGESGELRDEVTRLARQFGIVTPYTAYLIVEDEARRNVPALSRTMQSLDGAGALRTEVASNFREMTRAKSGLGAVEAAQANQELKLAERPASPAAMKTEFYGVAGQRRELPQQQVKFIRGRTFYQNGAEWIDANVQQAQGARRVEIAMGSDAYFDLIRRHRDAAAWLSVGQQVQVLLGDTVYIVR